MIGIQHTSNGFRIVHYGVKEDEANSRSKAKAYKCTGCGQKWIENINSPILMSEKIYCGYYKEKDDIKCFKAFGDVQRKEKCIWV